MLRVFCEFSTTRDRHRHHRTTNPLSPKPVGFGLTNTSLALAVAGEMAAPALLPACAVLLVGSNLDTFRAAGRQLLHGQLGLPVLYTSIVAATLASGQFIASAAMSWMLTFWHRRYRDRIDERSAQAAGPDHPAAALRPAGNAGAEWHRCRGPDRRSQAKRRDLGLGRRTDPRGWTGSPRPRLGRRADGPGRRGTDPQTARRRGLRRLDPPTRRVTHRGAATRIRNTGRRIGPGNPGGDHAAARLANPDPARRDVRRTDRRANHGHRRPRTLGR